MYFYFVLQITLNPPCFTDYLSDLIKLRYFLDPSEEEGVMPEPEDNTMAAASEKCGYPEEDTSG